VAMPVWSRDGTRIVFKLISPRSPANEPALFGDLVVINADGSNPITIVREAKGMSPAAWSPDGRWLLYSLLEGGGTIDQVYIAAADGSSPPTRIGDPATINWAPTFSPDGTHIAFLVDFAVDNHGVAVVNRDGSGLRMLNTTEFTELHSGQWHPDGTRFVVSAAATNSVDLWVLHLDGSEQQLRSSGRDEEGASWSPDGLRLAYLGTTNGTAATLNVADADGTNDRIMPGVFSLIAPTWSPDGSRIAAVNDIGSTARVTLLDPDGVAEPIFIDGALPAASMVAPRSDSTTWQRKAP
jgi:TolB protein